MTPFPQLRLRSEYSFRTAFGSVEAVAAAARAAGAVEAGLVDTSGTWGHVSWQKAALEVGIEPLFGAEMALDGLKYWVLATDLPALYAFTSNPPITARAPPM